MALPLGEQLSLVDRAGLGIGRNGYIANPGGDELAAARYSARQQPTPQPTGPNHAFPTLHTGTDARAWMNLYTASGSTDSSRCILDYPDFDGAGGSEQWSAKPTTLAMQFEVQLDHGSGGVAGNLNLFQVTDSGGNQLILRSNASEQFVLRYYNGAGSTNLLFDAGVRAIGNATTYTFWLFIDCDAGTIDLWHAEGSITDVDILDAAPLVTTKNPWSGGAQVTNLGLTDIANWGFFSGPTSNATADINLRTRCVWTGDAFEAEPDGTASLFDMHRLLAEKSHLWHDNAAGGYVLSSTVNVPVGLLPCASTCDAQLVVYPSVADYQADTNAVYTSPATPVPLVNGYRRLNLNTPPTLDPSTTYVYAWRLTLQDPAYNGGAAYTVTGLDCYVRTGPERGQDFDAPPRIAITSCEHQDLAANCARRERALLGWTGDCQFGIECGDRGYPDEVRFVDKVGDWDGSGSGEVTAETSVAGGGLGQSAEGAETPQQLSDEFAKLMHAYYALQEARFWVWIAMVGDDHDRLVNDAAGMDMLQENRHDDGAGTKITPWTEYNKGIDHEQYPTEVGGPLDGLPRAGWQWFADIPGDKLPKYNAPPREVAETIIDQWATWGIDFIPPVSSGQRFDASTVNKYDATPFNQHDAGYYYHDLGQVRIVVLDTRLSMTFWPDAPWGDGGPSFFSWAKQWVKDVIASCDLPGVIFVMPGYLQGYARGGLKAYDCLGWFLGTAGDTPEIQAIRAEIIEIFKTAIDANPHIKWWGQVCGDNHFASLDATPHPSLSKKARWFGSDGGGGSFVQNIESLGQEGDPEHDIQTAEDYVWLTNFDLDSGAIRTWTEISLLNAKTGAARARLWDCAGTSPTLVGDAMLAGVGTGGGQDRTKRLLALGLEGADS